MKKLKIIDKYSYIYAITPGKGQFEDLLPRIVDLLLDRHLVQIREKTASPRQLVGLLTELGRRVPAEAMRRLLINDRCDVALSVPGPGLHLPEVGLPVSLARTLLGSQRMLGVSCHGIDRILEAWRAGADFATLSPVFSTPGKGRALGIEAIRSMSFPAGFKVFGLGGLHAGTVSALAGTSLHGLACIRAVFGQTNPREAAEELQRLFAEARRQSIDAHGQRE